MLVMGRRVNDRIILETADGAIQVMVTKVRGGQVYVGIDAPASVSIRRGELADREAQQQ